MNNEIPQEEITGNLPPMGTIIGEHKTFFDLEIKNLTQSRDDWKARAEKVENALGYHLGRSDVKSAADLAKFLMEDYKTLTAQNKEHEELLDRIIIASGSFLGSRSIVDVILELRLKNKELKEALEASYQMYHHIIKCPDCASALIAGFDFCDKHRELLVKAVMLRDIALSITQPPEKEQ